MIQSESLHIHMSIFFRIHKNTFFFFFFKVEQCHFVQKLLGK